MKVAVGIVSVIAVLGFTNAQVILGPSGRLRQRGVPITSYRRPYMGGLVDYGDLSSDLSSDSRIFTQGGLHDGLISARPVLQRVQHRPSRNTLRRIARPSRGFGQYQIVQQVVPVSSRLRSPSRGVRVTSGLPVTAGFPVSQGMGGLGGYSGDLMYGMDPPDSSDSVFGHRSMGMRRDTSDAVYAPRGMGIHQAEAFRRMNDADTVIMV